MPQTASPTVVLIVDDEPPNVSTFVRVFRRDWKVLTAISGQDALKTLERESVDVLITDYTMPQMSGIDLLKVVAQRFPAVARIMISGHAEIDELRNAEHSGLARALLPKPWSRDNVLDVVARVLNDVRAASSA